MASTPTKLPLDLELAPPLPSDAPKKKKKKNPDDKPFKSADDVKKYFRIK